jgi:hypothetical protein
MIPPCEICKTLSYTHIRPYLCKECYRAKLEATADITGAELIEKMQQPGFREAIERAFAATPEEIGRAAVEYAKKKKNHD